VVGLNDRALLVRRQIGPPVKFNKAMTKTDRLAEDFVRRDQSNATQDSVKPHELLGALQRRTMASANSRDASRRGRFSF
jgi:hypothetical protein